MLGAQVVLGHQEEGVVEEDPQLYPEEEGVVGEELPCLGEVVEVGEGEEGLPFCLVVGVGVVEEVEVLPLMWVEEEEEGEEEEGVGVQMCH